MQNPKLCCNCQNICETVNLGILCINCEYPTLPPIKLRIPGSKFTYNENTVIWTGKYLHCEHGTRRSKCKKGCGGGSYCEHGTQRSQCKECNPNGYLTHIMRGRVYSAIKYFSPNNPKNLHTMEYVGCDINTLRDHLETQLKDGMTWENQGEWHIDHIKPCASFDITKEDERMKCFNYTNLQPLWGTENMSKGSTHDENVFNKEWTEKNIWELKV